MKIKKEMGRETYSASLCLMSAQKVKKRMAQVKKKDVSLRENHGILYSEGQEIGQRFGEADCCSMSQLL